MINPPGMKKAPLAEARERTRETLREHGFSKEAATREAEASARRVGEKMSRLPREKEPRK